MDIERQRVQDDLRGIVRGDVLCDPLTTQLYSSDASIYQIRPLGVIRPRVPGDVVATVQYAAEHDLAIHPRGSGSGVAGESIGPGLVLDFSRYMQRITTSEDLTRVTVQSGVMLADLNQTLRGHGRWYGPDPMTRSITTMGSVLATNASGSHYLRSGAARDTIESLRMVTADGDFIQVRRQDGHEESTTGRLARGIVEIRNQFQDSIERFAGEPMSRGGYRLDDVVDEEGVVDLAKFMVGTQGTLGIIVDATVRTELIPAHRGLILLFYHRLDAAARGAVGATSHGVVACDLMDRRLLQISRETDTRFDSVLPREAEAMLLVEIQGESLGDLYDRLSVIREDLTHSSEGAFASVDTVKPSERDMYWALSRRVIPRLARVRGVHAPLPFTDDIWVPPTELPQVLTAVQDTLKSLQATATVFAHAGHGQLHLRPFLNLADANDRDRLMRLSQDIAEVVWKHGGQISVEHAAGLSRSYLMPRQFGEMWQALGQVKRLFDPFHRLNPGKYFGAVLQKPNENLRPADQSIEVVSDNRVLVHADQPTVEAAKQRGESVAQLQVLQHWPAGATINQVTRGCNGCARCRAHAPGERQCPVFRAAPREEASPRAKANLLRAVLAGQLRVEDLAEDSARDIAELCFNCHQCRVECPASVDIPKIVGELKAQYVATNGLPVSEILLGRIDTISAIASRFPTVANAMINSPAVRWLAERMFGLSAARDMPRVAGKTFLRHSAARRWTKSKPHGGLKVAYYVDHYANFHDPDIGRALAEILQQNSIGLYVPPTQIASGMARVSAGDLRGARKIARRNVRMLAECVRQGYTVLATEPSAVLCLKHEYPNLLDDEDAHLVAQHSHEACEFLWNLHKEDRLSMDFKAIRQTIAYHQPCHLRVLDPVGAGPNLMELIPELTVQRIEAGCSGMAGLWGLQRKNYRHSLRIGWPLISAMRAARVSAATTECSACKMQIEHGSGNQTIHPIKLLAYAYGRMPKVGDETGWTTSHAN